MKQSKATKLAFAAGLIEGDGSLFVIHRASPEGWIPCVEFRQKDGRLIDWFHGTFGGYVYKQKGAYLNFNGKGTKFYDGLYTWRLTSKKCTKFLKGIFPFLKVKKIQAELLIRLGSRNNHRKKVKGKFVSISKHEKNLRNSIEAKVKKENHTYQPSKV